MTTIGFASSAVPVVVFVPLFLLQLVKQGHSLGCFKCTSTNGSNVNCQDPFSSIDQTYDKDCHAPRPGKKGLFPGTQCLKMKYCYNANYCTWIRTCVADNGGMNSDSEIGRTDHCGFIPSRIKLNEEIVYGCITSCKADGCNAVSPVTCSTLRTLLISFISTLLCHWL